MWVLVICSAIHSSLETSVKGSECGFPGVPLNGSIHGSSLLFLEGEEVTYYCDEGFVLFGEEKRSCGTNGSWVGSLPECKLNLALAKSSLQSSTLWSYDPGLAVDGDPDSCSFTPRSSEQRWWQVHLGDAVTIQAVAVTISPGAYQQFTIFVIELLEGNKAMYKPCSKFEGKFENKKAVFLCNDGDGHPGQFVYIRDDREEQEYFGLCEVEVFEYKNVTMCGDPEQPVSSVVNRQSVSLVEYSCVKGFRLIGEPLRHCQTESGTWGGLAPRCIEVQCDHPKSVKDGFIEVSNFRGKYVFGSLATYHCNPGYILWGNASRLCGHEGTWSGMTPQCKPITCGQPPEVSNARSSLINGSTLWQSFASYECKPGFRMQFNHIIQSGSTNKTQVHSMCTESGIWQTVQFSCIFDPLAISLEEGSLLEGWKTLNGDATMNASVMVTIAVLATLIILSLIIVVIFFTHKRISKDGSRKTSQSSTAQLMHENGKGPNGGLEGHHLYREKESGMMYNTIDTRPSASQRREHQAHAANLKSQFDTFPRHHQHSALTITTTTTTTNLGGSSTLGSNEAETSLGRSVVASVHQLQQQLSTFKPPQCSPLLLQIPASHSGHAHHRTSSGVELGSHRSSGDGGSEIDMDSEAPYATLKTRNEIETEEEEESHYSLIRQPDGRADDPAYSPLGIEGGYLGSTQSSDDAGYESLHQHQEALKAGNLQPSMNVMGIESTEVREKVYETLRRHEDIMSQSVLSTGCSSSGSSHSVTAVPGSKSIKGIRSSLALRFSHPVPDPQPSPPELPPPPENCDISELYAKVDRSKKKKNRDSASSSDTTPCSPQDRSSTLPGHVQSQMEMSPTKSLIQKFNTLGTHERLEGASPGRRGTAHRKVTHVQSNPTHSTSSSSLSTTPSSSATPTEPMYATIGNKNRRLTAFHHAANV